MKEVTIEGRQPVLEALKAGRKIKTVYIAEGTKGTTLGEIKKKAEQRGIKIRYVPRQDLEKMSVTGSEQGVIALGEPKAYVEVDDILQAAASKGELPFVLALDQIQDPQNFGSIIRTAEAVGIHGIIIPKNRAVAVTPSVVKVSAGAVEYVPIAQGNIAAALDFLKTQGCWVVGTEANTGVDCFEADLTGGIVLVIGSEGQGLRRLVKEKCDVMVKIPMLGSVNSLNAANAASVLMYEVLRQRRQKV
ncbi:MAG: 23S rRNA (guanosine(2251)-2'-O)-methyltransferase RlmB [Bacillota bacterium]